MAAITTFYHSADALPLPTHAYFTINFYDSLRASISPISYAAYTPEHPALPCMLLHLHPDQHPCPANLAGLILHLHGGTKAWKQRGLVTLTIGSDDGDLPLRGAEPFARLYQVLRDFVVRGAGRKTTPGAVAVQLTRFFGLNAMELAAEQRRQEAEKARAAVAGPVVPKAGGSGGETVVAGPSRPPFSPTIRRPNSGRDGRQGSQDSGVDVAVAAKPTFPELCWRGLVRWRRRGSRGGG
ncbi:hypothetical protein B0A55_00084 [Friedmanniomyces simplex]|uniref:Uncharacterized protein n=1 Tax=Friedmanniomyces simplex TaxID=329884 RepID=A0A4U0Y3K8_9PEZI|nr:hypothetical protein B0A55_00084 [Friedmanniomyces simplex]